jgi:RNA polymerase sigma factor (sigma-70 family)
MNQPEYLEKALQHKSYTLEEEREATKGMSREQKEHFWIENNLLFARRQAIRYCKKFKNSNRINEDDLFGAACNGLVLAARLFKEESQNKFLSYAKLAIKSEILSFISKNAYSVKLTRETSSLLNKVKEYIEDYRHNNGFDPSPRNISKYFGTSENNIEILLTLPVFDQSLDAPLAEGEDSNGHDIHELVNQPSSFDRLCESDRFEIVKTAMNILTDRERAVLVAKFGTEEMRLAEVGRQMKLTRQRIHQIYLQAIDKIKKYLVENEYEKEDLIY